MKKTILTLGAILALVACGQQENGNYNPSDALSFGMTGDVKTVRLSRELVSRDDESDFDDPMLEVDELSLAFDETGRVLKDIYGDPYEYDADGKFVRGYSDKTTMARDDKGRLQEYDNATLDYEDDFDYEDLNIEEVFHYEFTYDAQGRVASSELGGWEWMTTYTYAYDGKKPYPASATYETFEEGYVEDGTITYEYTKFDAKGNWTERTVTDASRLYEEGFEEDAENSTLVTREYRTIDYWSDKE